MGKENKKPKNAGRPAKKLSTLRYRERLPEKKIRRVWKASGPDAARSWALAHGVLRTFEKVRGEKGI